jgi:hypothetical protein
MDDFIMLGSAHGRAVRAGALKSGWALQKQKTSRNGTVSYAAA